MKYTVLALLLIASLVSCKQEEDPFAHDIQTAKVTGGIVKGKTRRGVTVFKGIPYAAPPVGDLRWKAPQPVIPWQDTLVAEKFGPAPVQEKTIATKYFQNATMSEDCLYLNVWSGAKEPQEKLPVMVWIHGGGFVGGATSIPAYFGTPFAKRGIVYVSFGYRVGAMGFLAHPELSKESGKGSGCYGIQDQIAGLEWVKENISKFGGDPNNVTIFGESAGGFSVSMLSAIPEAKGLFHRMICQSGAYMSPLMYDNEAGLLNISLEKAEKFGEELMAKFDAYKLDDIRSISAESIQDSMPDFYSFSTWPTADGGTIRGDSYELYKQGKFNDVPMMIGFNSDEGNFFLRPHERVSAEDFNDFVNNRYEIASEKILEAYPHSTEDETFKSQKDLLRDAYFGWPTWASANLHSQKSKYGTYVYYFDYNNNPELYPDGCDHGAEVPFVLQFPMGINMGKLTDTDKLMMDQISTYWINFAKNGNPNGEGLQNWPTYDSDNQKVLLIHENSKEITFPHIEKMKAYDEYFSWRREQNKSRK
ncbi:carboxylesterase/lipase family protein [Plebeiibacterium marinum]|uniref:Carboxylic ester hydrolase n=1 Tax=Plebeiibacterium marinum TaxID=2992111 RepID=A0AAE3MHA8_9BACT|nr:carboxylesterase family protein [Plebeiobacterium marinum]MCW3807047.1 carboxylesterase family protein [Plebeiobacterium marinum]